MHALRNRAAVQHAHPRRCHKRTTATNGTHKQHMCAQFLIRCLTTTAAVRLCYEHHHSPPSLPLRGSQMHTAYLLCHPCHWSTRSTHHAPCRGSTASGKKYHWCETSRQLTTRGVTLSLRACTAQATAATSAAATTTAEKHDPVCAESPSNLPRVPIHFLDDLQLMESVGGRDAIARHRANLEGRGWAHIPGFVAQGKRWPRPSR